MAQDIFLILGSFIRNLGKGPKGRNVYKIPVRAEPAHIHLSLSRRQGNLRGLSGISGDLQAPGIIVGGAGGKIAQHRPFFQRHEARYHIV